MVGASGTVAGVTGLEVTELVLVPMALEAVTTKVYDTPLVRPVTVMDEEVLVAVNIPGLEVAV